MECDKRSYESVKDASDDLIGLRQRHRRHKFSTYKCPACGFYHITTITKKHFDQIEKYPIEIPSKQEPKQKSKKNKK